jgi:hypothetical protein
LAGPPEFRLNQGLQATGKSPLNQRYPRRYESSINEGAVAAKSQRVGAGWRMKTNGENGRRIHVSFLARNWQTKLGKARLAGILV